MFIYSLLAYLCKKTCLISHPEISESDVEERSQNNSTQDSKHPESGLMLEGSGWIEEKRGHDDDQGKGIVVGLQYKVKHISFTNTRCFLRVNLILTVSKDEVHKMMHRSRRGELKDL